MLKPIVNPRFGKMARQGLPATKNLECQVPSREVATIVLARGTLMR